MKNLILIYCISSFCTLSSAQLLDMTSQEGRYGLYVNGIGKVLETEHDTAIWCKDKLEWYAVVGDNGLMNLYHYDLDKKELEKIEGDPFTDVYISGGHISTNDSLGRKKYYSPKQGWLENKIAKDSIVVGINSKGKYAFIKDQILLTPYEFNYCYQYENYETWISEKMYIASTDTGRIALGSELQIVYPYAFNEIRKVAGVQSAWVVYKTGEDGQRSYGWFDLEDESYFNKPIHILDWRKYFEMDDEVYLKSAGPYIVKENDGWGLVDENQKTLIPFVYKKLFFLTKNYPSKILLGYIDGTWTVFKKNLKIITTLEIDNWVGITYNRERGEQLGLIELNGYVKFLDLKKFEILDATFKTKMNKYRTPDGRRGSFDSNGKIINPFE